MSLLRSCTLIVSLLVLTGCGSGGDGTLFPGSRDLNGLEGSWTAQLNLSGQLDGRSFNQTDTFTFIVSRTSVRDLDGDFWDWTYDGQTLQIELDEDSTVFDPDCGAIRTTGTDHLNWHVTPGATVASITGSVSGLRVDSDNCGTATGFGNYSGTGIR